MSYKNSKSIIKEADDEIQGTLDAMPPILENAPKMQEICQRIRSPEMRRQVVAIHALQNAHEYAYSKAMRQLVGMMRYEATDFATKGTPLNPTHVNDEFLKEFGVDPQHLQ